MRIAFVGTGTVTGRYHVPAVRGVPEVGAAMAIDAVPEVARNFAERYCIPAWGTDIQELRGRADIAILAVPNHLHEPLACALLQAGIHVLCEKPMARTVEECRRMIEAAESSGSLLCIGHNRRFRRNVRLAKKLVQRGQIGEIRRVEAEEGSEGGWPYSPFYFDRAKSGGGVLMDVGIHSIDLVRWFAGDFEEVRYSGDGTDAAVESNAELRFKLSSGASGTLRASRTRNLAQRMIFEGSDGALEIGLWSPSLRIRCRKGKMFQTLAQIDVDFHRRAADVSFIDHLTAFASAIRGGERHFVDGREGMAAVSVVRGAYGGKGRPVKPLGSAT